ncbi:MAG: hypothetical protein RJA99_2914 [Pseudomonadota bacterium]|jgi:hypothetical protein
MRSASARGMSTRLRTLASIVALATASTCASAQQAKQTKQATEEMRLARHAVRCSVVYGMAAAASKGGSDAAEIQRDLVRAATRLGATPDRIERWLAEFDADFREATSPSGERGNRIKDPGFMTYQIDWCQELLRSRGRELSAALER